MAGDIFSVANGPVFSAGGRRVCRTIVQPRDRPGGLGLSGLASDRSSDLVSPLGLPPQACSPWAADLVDEIVHPDRQPACRKVLCGKCILALS